jgi:hypothetical protein
MLKTGGRGPLLTKLLRYVPSYSGSRCCETALAMSMLRPHTATGMDLDEAILAIDLVCNTVVILLNDELRFETRDAEKCNDVLAIRDAVAMEPAGIRVLFTTDDQFFLRARPSNWSFAPYSVRPAVVPAVEAKVGFVSMVLVEIVGLGGTGRPDTLGAPIERWSLAHRLASEVLAPNNNNCQNRVKLVSSICSH